VVVVLPLRWFLVGVVVVVGSFVVVVRWLVGVQMQWWTWVVLVWVVLAVGVVGLDMASPVCG
jgi:hypothetical protein